MTHPLRDLPTKIRNHLAWRGEQVSHWAKFTMAPRAGRHSGWLARRWRWLWPGLAPCWEPELHVGRKSRIGDVLLCTPTLRRLKEVNPGCRLTFYTELTSLLDGLPFIDEVRPYDEAPPGIIDLWYEESIPPWRHLARIIGDTIGVDVRDVRPACVVKTELKEEFLRTWGDLPRPWVVVNRHASAWTPNKDWPGEHWEVLIDRLQTWATVFEIGSTPHPGGRLASDRYVNLIGQLSLDQLVAVIAVSDLNVGPISGPVHVAAAVEVPSVVVFGGYEPPVCTHYPGNIDLYSKVECAPCWLREPCPFEKKCLTRISADVVEGSLRQIWETSRSRGDHRDHSYVVRIG